MLLCHLSQRESGGCEWRKEIWMKFRNLVYNRPSLQNHCVTMYCVILYHTICHQLHNTITEDLLHLPNHSRLIHAIKTSLNSLGWLYTAHLCINKLSLIHGIDVCVTLNLNHSLLIYALRNCIPK